MKHFMIAVLVSMPFWIQTATNSTMPHHTMFAYTRAGFCDSHPLIDVILMAKTLNGEAIGEPYTAKVAVASTMVNRARHYGETMPETLDRQFDGKGSAQYVLTEEAVRIASNCLTKPEFDYLYFYSPSLATDTAFVRWAEGFKRDTIGKQLFFR